MRPAEPLFVISRVNADVLIVPLPVAATLLPTCWRVMVNAACVMPGDAHNATAATRISGRGIRPREGALERDGVVVIMGWRMLPSSVRDRSTPPTAGEEGEAAEEGKAGAAGLGCGRVLETSAFERSNIISATVKK